MTDGRNSLTYKDAGVDIDAGEALVARIAPAARATRRPGADADLGGFGGLFDLKAAGFRDPVLVASTDGVGTKLKIAIDTGLFGGIGQDLVAMCVNDLVVQGAEPLFFLDYYATGKLNVDDAAVVIEGIAKACRESGCALIGGETAEMPGLYAKGDFDLAGFSVGAVERGHVLPKTGAMREGDIVIGVASSGVHSNGYSLVRRVVEQAGAKYDAPAPFDASRSLGEALLAPTRLYIKSGRTSRAAASRRTCRAPCPTGWTRRSTSMRGPCRRCSAGWRSRRGSRRRKCCGRSTAGWDSWPWSRRTAPGTSSTRSRRRARRRGGSANWRKATARRRWSTAGC